MAYIKHHPLGNVYYFIDAPDKSVRCLAYPKGIILKLLIL